MNTVINQNKFKSIDTIQKQFRRGMRTEREALQGIREVMEYPITQEYCEWLLYNYFYN